LLALTQAESSEAVKLCNAEIKKEHPDRAIVRKECLLAAEENEREGRYRYSSWYYLLAGKNKYNVEHIAKQIPINGNFSNVAYSNVLLSHFADIKPIRSQGSSKLLSKREPKIS